MGNKELDNIKTAALTELLCEDAILCRYYPLVARKQELIRTLSDMGTADKYDWQENRAMCERLMSDKGFDEGIIRLFGAFMHLYDYRQRKLNAMETVDAALIDALSGEGIRTSGELLKAFAQRGYAFVAQHGVCADELRRLLCLCDLMRLPGVGEIRAQLYYDCGFTCVRDFAEHSAEEIRAAAEEYIRRHESVRSAPLMKELRTQAAVAKALPQFVLREA